MWNCFFGSFDCKVIITNCEQQFHNTIRSFGRSYLELFPHHNVELSTIYHENTRKNEPKGYFRTFFKKNRSLLAKMGIKRSYLDQLKNFTKNDRKIHFLHRSHDTKASYQVFLVVNCLFKVSDLLNQSRKNNPDTENNPSHNVTKFFGRRF